jgi:hypothetical protein
MTGSSAAFPWNDSYHAAALMGDPLAVEIVKIGGEVHLSDVAATKIDAEGAELEVLHGAWMALRRWRPILSIEIEERHRLGSTRSVPELLNELGHAGWFEFSGEWRRIKQLDIATMQRAFPSTALSLSHERTRWRASSLLC